MLNAIRDYLDTSVSMIILVDDIEQLSVLAKVFVSTGRKRISYEIYKNEITAYMIELRMPYNRYLKMMEILRKYGYTLKPETKVDVFNRMIKM